MRSVSAISGDSENGALSGKSQKHFIMAFIKTLEPAVKYMRGKFNKSDSTYYKQMYNHTIGVRVDNPYKGPASAAQTAVKDKFKACWTATDTELADASKHATWLAKFKKQRKYKTLRTYVFKQLYPTINI